MSCKPMESTILLSSALSVPFVPTATKFGVSITPWAVTILPTRARDFFDRWRISNRNMFLDPYKKSTAEDDDAFDKKAQNNHVKEGTNDSIEPRNAKANSI